MTIFLFELKFILKILTTFFSQSVIVAKPFIVYPQSDSLPSTNQTVTGDIYCFSPFLLTYQIVRFANQ